MINTELIENGLIILIILIFIFAVFAYERSISLARDVAVSANHHNFIAWLPYNFIIIYFIKSKLDEEGLLNRKKYFKWLLYFLASLLIAFIVLYFGIEILKIIDDQN